MYRPLTMAERQPVGLFIIVIAGTFLLIGISFGILEWRHSKNALRTPATIVGWTRGNPRPIVKYRFRDTEVIESVEQDFSGYRSYKIGDQVTVLIDPDRKWTPQIDTQWNYAFPGVMAIGGLIGVVAGIKTFRKPREKV